MSAAYAELCADEATDACHRPTDLQQLTPRRRRLPVAGVAASVALAGSVARCSVRNATQDTCRPPAGFGAKASGRTVRSYEDPCSRCVAGAPADLSRGPRIVSVVIIGSIIGILPYRRADQMTLRYHARNAFGGPLAARKVVRVKGYIVIVEPDDLIRELLERWLGEAGYGIILSAKDHRPSTVRVQLVIADISRADNAGTTIGTLRVAYSAPILALSARFRRGLAGSSETAHRLHVGKVLPKPFTREELLAAVSEAIAGP
jgi:CheY-like chemotaxis protein